MILKLLRSVGISLLLFSCFPGWSQIQKNYSPAPILDTISADMRAKLMQKLEKDKARINEPKAQVNTFLKTLLEKRYDYLIKTVNDDNFINDPLFTPYLQSVLDKIYRANPGLQAETQVFALRSAVPNAMSFGDGTLGFTLSLIARLENEDQLAFVLCHEVAHYHSEHSITDLKELARVNYDKELKQKIEAARRSQYGQYTKLTEVFKGMGLSLNRHSRIHEFEADSLGFVYFANTDYDPRAAIRVMEILDSVKIPLHQNQIDLKKHFDFKDYPLKSAWLTYTKSTTWHSPEEEADSLRTHPDCKKRAVALERQILRLPPRTSLQTANDVFSNVRTQSEFEIIESEYHFKHYGAALFRALLLSETYPDNIYLQAIIGKCLYKLFIYQRNHELGKVLELPDPRFPDNYDRFLTFMQKLRLMEIASIAYNYMATRPVASYEDEEFLYALWLCSTLQVSKLDPDKVKEAYLQKFPDGIYRKQMSQKTIKP